MNVGGAGEWVEQKQRWREYEELGERLRLHRIEDRCVETVESEEEGNEDEDEDEDDWTGVNSVAQLGLLIAVNLPVFSFAFFKLLKDGYIMIWLDIIGTFFL